MPSSLCGGKFYDTFYRFDNDTNIYHYNKVTFVAEQSSTSILKDTDLVTSIKKCVYNGVNAIYFIGTTEENLELALYSAEFDNVSHNFTFQELPDPTNGSLNNSSTVILPIDHWTGLQGCVMVGYGKSSFGVACPDKPSVKVLNNLSSGISTTRNLYMANDSQLYQLTAEGLKSFSVTTGDKLSSIAISNSSSAVYKFQKPNMIDSNAVWKITTSEDSSQALFYNSGPSFQLIKTKSLPRRIS
ncbi:uncharacterized protein EV154DRAFT_229337 [Mucor mucedo]|uniref:uncharacterized protein n=1 Tax=Mucor mucedo TaxID=29922 RepID=UPI0022203BC9|nr:uncharacterized protein EV154DRAFT_229337 [Mucor mucedo]KAI7891249.1 hypothetical protein EV154DRAFT_229337 [Mucor mucedo]